MAIKQEYIPGVCNIGPAEIRWRRFSGYLGIVVTVILWVGLITVRAPAYMRFLLFLPASMAAVGFLQAYLHFCARFGVLGVFNFGPKVGRTDTVQQAEFRARDRRKAAVICVYSGLVGLLVALVAFVVG